jgi:hypothetical protein
MEVVPKAVLLLKDPQKFIAERQAEGRRASSAPAPTASASVRQ